MSLAEKSTEFLNYLEDWLDSRPTLKLNEVISKPEETAIISVDVINAFLYEGPLSSSRVAPIGKSISNLMKESWDLGLRDILLVQDRHSAETLEFSEYGEHAVAGTEQAEAIDLIKKLPFYDKLTTIYKDSIHPALNNGFDEWVDQREQVNTFIAVGDVTDLCVYQLAMYLKLRANAYKKERRVIVPANCVQTWHLSVEDAEDLPAMPHHGDMLHATFLYHMALNGIEVVKEIVP
jgi:nicotinamidase-related amidase